MDLPVASQCLRSEDDVVHARQWARRAAAALGLSDRAQTRLAAAVTALSQYGLDVDEEVVVEYLVTIDSTPQQLIVEFRACEGWIQEPEEGGSVRAGPNATGRPGLFDACSLVDSFRVEVSAGTACARIGCRLPAASKVDRQQAEALAAELSHSESHDAYEEFARQNLELVRLVRELHNKESQLAEAAQTLDGYTQSVSLELYESRRRRLLSQKLESIGQIAMSVAHEVRNPLASLKLRLFSLRRMLVDRPDCEADMDVMAEELERLNDFINSFLEFSRLPKPELCSTDIPALLENCVGLLRSQLDEDGVVLEVNVQEELPRVETDPRQLKQVFINMVLNASEAMAGGGNVMLRASHETDEAGCPMVVIRVSDDGPGVAEDAQSKIFSPYFTTKERGTGLGLSAARQIVEAHAGRLVLESTSSAGTVFSVWLPASLD